MTRRGRFQFLGVSRAICPDACRRVTAPELRAMPCNKHLTIYLWPNAQRGRGCHAFAAFNTCDLCSPRRGAWGCCSSVGAGAHRPFGSPRNAVRTARCARLTETCRLWRVLCWSSHHPSGQCAAQGPGSIQITLSHDWLGWAHRLRRCPPPVGRGREGVAYLPEMKADALRPR